MAPRWVGALLYAAAAAAAAVGALAAEGPPSFTAIRESAPLAAVLGAVIGFGVNSRWPQRFDAAIATGLLTALISLVFFSGLFLVSSAFIEAYLGRSATEAVAAASSRLGQHLPVGAPLAVAGFVAAALLMWVFGAIGRLLFRERPSKNNADAAESGAG